MPLSLKLKYGEEIRRLQWNENEPLTLTVLVDQVKKIFGIAVPSIALFCKEEQNTLRISTEQDLKKLVDAAVYHSAPLYISVSLEQQVAPPPYIPPQSAPIPMQVPSIVSPFAKSPSAPIVSPPAMQSPQPQPQMAHSPIDNRQFNAFTQNANNYASNVLPQFFGTSNLPPQAPKTNQDASVQLFSAFGQIMNSVPKEQMANICGNLMTNPMVTQMMHQILISLTAMNVNPQQQPAQASKPRSTVMHSAICNGCSNRIVGIRYKCSECADYDLCEACEEKNIHDEHIFLKIKKALPEKPAIVLDSVLDSDTIVDGTVLIAGSSFTKTWKLRNTGNTRWPVGTTLAFVAGDRLSVVTEVPVDSVGPNESTSVSVNCVVPSTVGNFVSYWRLTASDGSQFGAKIWINIKVEKSLEAIKQEQLEVQQQMERMKLKAQEEARIAADLKKKAEEEELRKREEQRLLQEERLRREMEERRAQEERKALEIEEKRRAEEQERLRKEEEEQSRRLAEERRAAELKQLLEHQRQVEEEERKKAAEASFPHHEGLVNLRDMGFVDTETNKALLLKYNGDIMKAIQDLLNQ